MSNYGFKLPKLIIFALNQDERAKDDLTLKRVNIDVARRLQAFTKAEKAREHLERIAKEHAEEFAAKKRAYVYNNTIFL